MVKLIDEADREQAAFELAWKALQPQIVRARAVQQQSVADPGLLSDDRNETLLSWLERYPKEIVAVETLHDAVVDPLLDVPVHSLSLARQAADKLLVALQAGPPDGDDAAGNVSTAHSQDIASAS